LNAPESDAVRLSPVEPLSRSHDLSSFDCDAHPSLNDWLRRFAWINQQNETSRTYVVHRAQRVVGYYSVAAGSVVREAVPARIAKGLANHPVPILLLARLAIDHKEQGRGLGKALLKDALIRMAHAGDIVIIYCNGLGAVNPAIPTGTPAPTGGPLSQTNNPVTITIGGITATVNFAGLAPGYPDLYQVNAVVPSGVQPGPAVQVVLNVAGQTSPTVTMVVQ